MGAQAQFRTLIIGLPLDVLFLFNNPADFIGLYKDDSEYINKRLIIKIKWGVYFKNELVSKICSK